MVYLPRSRVRQPALEAASNYFGYSYLLDRAEYLYSQNFRERNY
jgi:hypothetical protein